MSSVAALGDGVDGTDVVVDPLPVIRENGRRQSLPIILKEKEKKREKLMIVSKGRNPSSGWGISFVVHGRVGGGAVVGDHYSRAEKSERHGDH